MFHVIILSIALLSEINQYPPVTFHVLIDPDMLDETPEEEVERLREELSDEVEKLYQQIDRQDIRNVVVNNEQNVENPTEYKSTMTEQEYEREIVRNALNADEFDKYVENKPVFDDQVALPEPERTVEPVKPVKSSYKGPATVTYYLSDRVSEYLDIPVYTCEGAAKITVNIVVVPSGTVERAEIDLQSSQFATDCYKRAALESAKNAIFSRVNSSKGNQKGTIVYHFIAQ